MQHFLTLVDIYTIADTIEMILPNDIIAESKKLGATLQTINGIEYIKFPHRKPVEFTNFLLCVGNKLMKQDLSKAVLSCSRNKWRDML